MTRQRVHRWSVGLLATLALTTLGIIYANAVLLAGTLVPLAYVLYGTLSQVPGEDALAVDRDIAQVTPAPGTRVEVTVTVENTGERVLPDVRLIDGIPEALAVETGTPRLCDALSPGESRTYSYTVVAKRGTYTFDRPVVRLRSVAGSERLTRELDVTGDDELVCVSTFGTGPRKRQTTPYAGVVTTDSGGSGLEFHSTRQYRAGDPVSRIDWRHVAKTGEFVTVQYREQKLSRTVLVLDARALNRVTPSPGHPTAVDRCAYAGERLYETVTDAAVDTTVAAVGLDETTRDSQFEELLDPAGIAWASPARETLAPATVFDAVSRVSGEAATQGTPVPPRIGADPVGDDGSDGRRADGAASGASADDPGGGHATASPRADGGTETLQLLERIPADARVILCSPLLDNWPVTFCRRLGEDHDLVVVSPDPADGATTGQQITAVHRRLRLRELQRIGASTVDWSVGQPFEIAFHDALPALPTHQ